MIKMRLCDCMTVDILDMVGKLDSLEDNGTTTAWCECLTVDILDMFDMLGSVEDMQDTYGCIT